MTGLFTYHNFSLEDTPSLEGQIAIVTVCLLKPTRCYQILNKLPGWPNGHRKG